MTSTQTGLALLQDGLARYQERDFLGAQRLFEEVLRLDAESFDALNLLGVTLNALGRHAAAIELFRRAIAVKADHPGAQNNLGMALRAMGRWDEALGVYNRVIELQPQFATVYTNRGTVFLELRRHQEALADYDHSLELRPDDAKTWALRGLAQRRLGRNGDSIDSFTRAIALDGREAEYYASRARSYNNIHRTREAIGDLANAVRLRPDVVQYLGEFIAAKRSICDWSDFEADRLEIERLIEQRRPVLNPWDALGMFDSARLQLKAAEAQANTKVKEERPPLSKDTGRVRVGFYSADWEQHPVMLLLLEAIALIDRERFHLTAFVYPRKDFGENGRDVTALVDDVVDLRGRSDQEAAQISRDHSIDIAVDLDGRTRSSRANIFAYRAAPIQVAYLGYSGTLGADYIDYIIADKTIIPEKLAQYYTEKPAWLPHCYMPRDRRLLPSEPGPTRAEAGLPATGTVFCSMNSDFKITPDAFADWMKILHAVPDSVLWLRDNHMSGRVNLSREAKARGIAPERLIFAPRVSLADHYARIAHSDLILDTPIYNSHTTASDALFAGVPVLTLPGEAFAGRVAASLLQAIGMPELIVDSREAYVRLAIEIGNDPAKVRALKAKLAENRKTYPLFDMETYTRHLESAFVEMVERHRKGLPFEAFEVAP